jgi:hypothetical protein
VLFEQLVDPTFTIIPDASSAEIIGAQMATSGFLDDDDDTPLPRRPPTSADTSLARAAFAAAFAGSESDHKANVLALKTPAAVQHHVTMLSQYDWDFVEQAKELRGYVVSRLLEETKHPDARIRLRSLELIGKVTEVAAFTERSEVIHKNEGASEIEERLRAKLKSLLPPVQEVETVTIKPTVAEKQHDV